MLIKTNPVLFENKEYIHPLLRSYKELVMLDYRLNTRSKNIIPINFNNKIVFVNINSFIQNNTLGFKIRKYVQNHIDNLNLKNVVSIGGESYLYFLNDFKYQKKFYTNNKLLFNDCIFNNKIYNNKISSFLVDYNKDKFINNCDLLLINLSKLNFNLVKQINKKNIKYIIIISCHHKDFWNKIKHLSNYKLKIRQKFIDEKIKYFITVSVFQKISKHG